MAEVSLAGGEDDTSRYLLPDAEQRQAPRYTETKRFRHPSVGEMDLHCQRLLDPDQDQALLVFTATPGSDSHRQLQLLGVVGTQRLEPDEEQPLYTSQAEKTR